MNASICYNDINNEIILVGNQGTSGSSGIIKQSYNDNVWYSRTPDNSFTNYLNGVCYSSDDELYVTVGDVGEIQTSSDGITWTHRTPDNSYNNYFKSVCYSIDDSLYIAVGWGAEIQTSPNGITWTKRTPDNSYSGNFNSICYGNGLYVAVGSDEEIQTSPDGITWTHRTIDPAAGWGTFTDNFSGCCYGNGLYVAVGGNGEIQTSTNGITWTHRTPDSSYSDTFLGCYYGNEIFIVLGEYEEIQTSSDGITWTDEFGSGGWGTLSTAIYTNGIFIAAGLDNHMLVSIPEGNGEYPTVPEPIIRRTGLNFSGNDYKKVLIRLKLSDPNSAWNAIIYWKTLYHDELLTCSASASYEADNNYGYRLIEFDLSEDPNWISNVDNVTGLTIHFNYDDWSSVSSGVIEIDYISINNINLTWNINHNLDSGGLIIQCFDSNDFFINPSNIELTDENNATITFSEETHGSANIVYLDKSFQIAFGDDDLLGIGVGENLGYWKIGNGTTYNYNAITYNDVESATLSGSYNRVFENDEGTRHNIEFIVEENDNDLTITEIGLFNQSDQLMFYTTCSPLFKPANMNLKVFYRINKIE